MAVEHEYLRHISQLDEAGLRSLMEDYGQSVWDYAFTLTRQRHLADDIAQDVFLKAYQHIGSFRGESSVKTWLFTITRNTAANYRRSAFFRKVVPFAFLPERGGASSAEQQYMAKAYADDLWEQVMALPARFREVLVLDARYEMTSQEIAAMLGISEGTVKSRLHRARKKIAQALKEDSGYETV